MARINISIADELRAEMDGMTWINWSRVAQEAFDRECRKHRRIEAMNTDQIAERLRASYEGTKSAENEAGHEAGATWAAETAEFEALKHLADGQDYAVDALHSWRVEDTPFENCDPGEFWETVTGDERAPSRAFVEGFVEGASEVFERVRDQVED